MLFQDQKEPSFDGAACGIRASGGWHGWVAGVCPSLSFSLLAASLFTVSSVHGIEALMIDSFNGDVSGTIHDVFHDDESIVGGQLDFSGFARDAQNSIVPGPTIEISGGRATISSRTGVFDPLAILAYDGDDNSHEFFGVMADQLDFNFEDIDEFVFDIANVTGQVSITQIGLGNSTGDRVATFLTNEVITSPGLHSVTLEELRRFEVKK
ncbi:MAG: hypothetical protein AAGH79_01665 [Bacteroidota bacterium]